MDVEAFAASFRKYDSLSQHWRPWARFYPGVELLVGLGVLIGPGLGMGERWIGALALHCACVGGNTKVPLGMGAAMTVGG